MKERHGSDECRRRVVVLQRVLVDYRVPLFDRVAVQLADKGISFSVRSGQTIRGEGLPMMKPGSGWHVPAHNRYLARGLYWQDGVLSAVKASDVVVIEQANAALHAYAFLLQRKLGRRPTKVILWGHGRDFSKVSGACLAERWKRLWSRYVDFWFAYTERSAGVMKAFGASSDRVVVLNNASDTKALAAAVRTVDSETLARVHAELWHEPRSTAHRVAVFCSRLLPSKGLDLLLDAGHAIHSRFPNFRLLVIGDGPLQANVDAFVRSNPWCARHPSIYGVDRAPLLRLADMWLNPGTTGLAILDAFACGIPFVTTERHDHGPEVAYLATDNGAIAEASVNGFASEVIALLNDPRRLESLKEGARQSHELYGIDTMAERFVRGIMLCLEAIDSPAGSRSVTDEAIVSKGAEACRK